MSTQEILLKLYDLVIEKLNSSLIDYERIFVEELETVNKIAKELNISISYSMEQNYAEDKNHSLKIALMPVAQKFVVEMLRSALNDSKRNSGKEYSRERLIYLSKRNFDLEQFAQDLGLREDDVQNAVIVTAEVLVMSDLFDNPVPLVMDGEEFLVTKLKDNLKIRHIDHN